MIHVLLKEWQPFAAAFVLLLMWGWESFAPFFSHKRRVRHATRNLVVSGINAILLALVFAGATVAISHYTMMHELGLLNLFSLSEPVHSVLAFVALDIWTYWWHRFNHTVPFLWRFHRMHHSDPEMDVTTATRFHIGEITMSSVLRFLIIVLVGIPVWVLIVYDVVLLASTQFHHSNIAINPSVDRFLRYIIVSPFMHKVHHSRLRPETDSNYTSTFSVWDRVFGSYREKDDYREIVFGVEEFDDDASQSVKGLLITPLRK